MADVSKHRGYCTNRSRDRGCRVGARAAVTTSGELLVSLSKLPSGSAAAHLLAITTGAGSGETIYAHRIFTVVSEPRHTYTQRSAKAVQPTVQAAKPSRTGKVSKLAYAHTEIAQGYIMSSSDSLTILSVKR